jgi:hypothetical protein
VGKPVESSGHDVDNGRTGVGFHQQAAVRPGSIHAPSTVSPSEFTGARNVIPSVHNCDDDNENLYTYNQQPDHPPSMI